MRLYFLLIVLLSCHVRGQHLVDSLYEDVPVRTSKENLFFMSEKVDFIQIQSTITDSVSFAIVVYKPEHPSPVLLLSHGWHMSVKPPVENSVNPHEGFLTVQVDMRGREYSTGKQDCNGYELYDFYDAYQYVIRNYRSFISDASQVYYEGGSGGGGNGYALVGKFPDLFCSAVISCGISNYAEWFEQDTIGEFRDEMLPWIGCDPQQNMEAYKSRSGITTVKNLLTPVYVIHGETDVRVPVSHARNFVQKARESNKEVYYLELEHVGTRSHWGNITEEQELARSEFSCKGLASKKPPQLPDKGELLVPGYLVTKYFSVFLDSIDSVGLIKYDIKRHKIRFKKGKGKIYWNDIN